MNYRIIRLTLTVLAFIIFYGIFPKAVSAFYPTACNNNCRTPGSYCVEPGTGYQCGVPSQCGVDLGLTPDCPSGCTCAWSRYTGASLACGNKCLHVLSCAGAPTPTPTPTPPPTGIVRGKIVLNDVAARCPGCSYSGAYASSCNAAPEFGMQVSVSDPSGGTYTASQCTSGGPGFETTTRSGTHNVSVSVPAGYYIGYTYCTNDTSCHASTPAQGNIVAVDVPPNGFVDLWWHVYAPGTIKVNSVTSTATCPDLLNSTSYFPEGLSAMQIAGLPDGTIVGNEKVWNNILTQPPLGKQYTVTPGTPPLGFAAGLTCWKSTKTDGSSTQGSGDTAYLKPNETLNWFVGYTPPGPWQSTAGGDVYAKSKVQALLPAHDPPHTFNKDGTGGIPGVVIYGSEFDFASDTSSTGADSVSTERWLANDNYSISPNFYTAFSTLLGSPTSQTWGGDSQPASCSPNPCYAAGPGAYNVTGNWTIPSSQKLIILVNGSLNINGEVKVQDGGFLAFIVKDDITVSDSVGTVDAASTDPQLEGVYIAGGSFKTGAGTKKLIAEGMYLASSFLLQRDYNGAANADDPAELFQYGPRFLISMPDEMKETLLRWEEVNP